MTAGNGSAAPRRSLILAGGGMKAAFQAGVLQVWLDEAGLTFDHVDAASGGALNLAMLCQGMSGTRIAQNWRDLPAAEALDINLRSPLTPITGESLLRLDKLRSRVLRARWGLDWDAIRASPVNATFTVYNCSSHALEAVPPERMSEDLLVACVSLPMWFPPVRVDGQTYVASSLIAEANLEEAIARGADELWVIWTIGERRDWPGGFIGSYFRMVEEVASSHLSRILRRIEDSNAAIERGEQGELGRPIAVRLLRSEVPLHFVLNFNPDRFTEAVERGVAEGRRWCAEQGIAAGVPPETEAETIPRRLWFSETMKGQVTIGDQEFEPHLGNGRPPSALSVHLTITAEDLEAFMHQPGHEARVEGTVHCEDLGGRLPIERGSFNLFVDRGDPAHKRMLYRLHFQDGVGHPLTLTGFKVIETETGRGLWRDTTTLYTRVLRGHLGPEEDAGAEVVAAGIIRVHLRDFMRQLTTFRAEGPSRAAGAGALARFGAMFIGNLWDVYARGVLSSSPI